MSQHLKISCNSNEVKIFDESYPAYTFEISADMTDMDVHEWFRIFEKVLLAAGFCEYVVMKGAYECAFSTDRPTAQMKRLYKEYSHELARLASDGNLPNVE